MINEAHIVARRRPQRRGPVIHVAGGRCILRLVTSRVTDATQILQKTKFNLLIADIVLPDGTAFAAIDEAKRRNMACLLTTGSWAHMAQLEANGELHLTKSFKFKDFTSQVLQRIGPGPGIVITEIKRTRVVLTAQDRAANTGI